jgi:AraC-like DNA-binding protein
MTTPLRHRGGLARWQLLRVRAEVDAHLSEPISNRQLADCVRLSPFHFARAFRQSTGMSPHTYVIRRRIERAAQLMLSTDATLCKIAVECGFADQSHLSRRFLSALGAAPGAWRRERTTGIQRESTIQTPAAIHTTPAMRAIHPPHGVSFSSKTSSARNAIQSTFITPPTNNSAIRTQQQPTQ